MGREGEKKPLILIVDHSPSKGNLLRDQLRELSGGRRKKRFQDHFRIELYLVKIHSGAEDNLNEIQSAAREISKKFNSQDYPQVVLVDLCMTHLPESHELGVSIAKELKMVFPHVPVWLYTTVEWSRDAIFAASSSAIDGMLLLNLPEQQPDELWDLFESSTVWQRETLSASLSSVFGAPTWFSVKWEGLTRPDGEFTFCRAAEALAFMLFGQTSQVASLVLRPMQQGFSGSTVIAVLPFDDNDKPLSNMWVMKVAEHSEEISKLKQELQGYSVVKHRMPLPYQPRLYAEGGVEFGCILDNWWAGFAFSLEAGFKPLIEMFSMIDPTLVYQKVFSECLNSLYGEAVGLRSPYVLPARGTLRRALAALEGQKRFRKVIKTLLPNYLDDCNRVEGFASTALTSMLERDTGKGFQYIHGDLNCRNIMVRANGNVEIKLIDFPHVVSPNLRPASTDFAKAETELLFLIMDHNSGREIDPAALTIWTQMFSKLIVNQELGKWASNDTETQNVYNCVDTIRNEYGRIVGKEDADWYQYRVVLLEHVLRILGYSDVTPMKRAAAVIYSRLILDSLGL